MSAPALETRGLSKSFGALAVADDIDFRLNGGSRHALIGPNGAGKTTFVNLVTGRLKPTAGTVLIAGQDVTALPQHRRVKQGLGRTFQINTLFLGLSVLDNVALAMAERHGIAWQMLRPLGRYRALLDEAHEMLVMLHLSTYAARPVRELSYGLQRLVEIAIALSLKPRVLLLDEPAAGVPTGETGLIIDTLAMLPSDIAVLIIEHDMDVVFRFARQITVLNQGRVLIEGAPDVIANDAGVRAIYFGEREFAHG